VGQIMAPSLLLDRLRSNKPESVQYKMVLMCVHQHNAFILKSHLTPARCLTTPVAGTSMSWFSSSKKAPAKKAPAPAPAPARAPVCRDDSVRATAMACIPHDHP
jgi:hypothetical protein